MLGALRNDTPEGAGRLNSNSDVIGDGSVGVGADVGADGE